MIPSSKEVESSSPIKREGNANDHHGKIVNAASPSSSTPWLRLKDPRIVRVSRAFGGKDRHSKVCTIRGLRDRRVRLSVPTAIQLYDLQDRLGLNQPSKVVDWLLNAAKHEIDELPPLPIPPGGIGLNQAMLSSVHGVGASNYKEGFKTNNSINWQDFGGLSRPNIWHSDALSRAKSKELVIDSSNEKEDDKQEGNGEGNVPSSNFLAKATHHSSSSSGYANNALHYGPFFHLEPSSFPLSNLGNHGFASQSTEDLHNVNIVPLPSTLSLSSGSQILVCQPGTTQPYFPYHPVENDPRQIGHFQMLTSNTTQNLLSNTPTASPYSISQSMRPFHFSLPQRFLHSQNSENHQPDKDQEEFQSKS